ncbi:lipoyltransferase and lipoate-protein ligase subfamily protein [Besnoitia besnoiti]|uniref:lipoate--protein ligase n=1 Tax=Besnoitia besnoiti TaxID=94643 RepID=A0A2A9MNP1_BESBE|nr:lipoyltransferase and lipoate-protein ligase subfamily protein [Besnoitia besnoiti]PFH37322.1 lipoyltransferase and lipoate-protein ligase subfamily protein [Besnoitia besnoiti]
MRIVTPSRAGVGSLLRQPDALPPLPPAARFSRASPSVPAARPFASTPVVLRSSSLLPNARGVSPLAALQRRAAFSTSSSSAGALRILSSASNDIVENLATECFLIDVFGKRAGTPDAAEREDEGRRQARADSAEARDSSVPLLFLWRNDKTIVIGRHQNAWRECNIQKMEEDGVTLARRYTGGGAVYQDLGNTCFTFLDPLALHSKERNNNIILRALEKAFCVKGAASGRNDLVAADGRKFSGAAYSKLPHSWLHHGTLMREVDCEALTRYLTPSKEKLDSKSIKSVASRVVNLKTLYAGITHENLCDAIIASFIEEYGAAAEKKISRDVEPVESLQVDGTQYRMREHPGFQTHLQTLSNWEWRYGHSPAFERSLSHRFPWGSFEVHVNVAHGAVTEAKIYSDCLCPELVDALTVSLRGCRFTEEDLKRAVLSTEMEKAPADFENLLKDFAGWISTASQE